MAYLQSIAMLSCPLAAFRRRGAESLVAVSAAMERSARFVAVLLLRHGGSVADEFSENRDRRFAGTVDPINTYAVVGVGVFRNLEHIDRSAVLKFHGQRIRRKDVVGDVTAPRSCNVFECHRVGDVCRTGRKQNLQSLQATGIS